MMTMKNSSIAEAILETAGDLHRHGLLDDEEYRKITVRHLGEQPLPVAKPIGSREIRSLRESANMSQAAFARTLNLSAGYISQLERGVKAAQRPGPGPAQCDSPQGVAAIL
jgi:putative transcriptional regulator